MLPFTLYKFRSMRADAEVADRRGLGAPRTTRALPPWAA